MANLNSERKTLTQYKLRASVIRGGGTLATLFASTYCPRPQGPSTLTTNACGVNGACTGVRGEAVI